MARDMEAMTLRLKAQKELMFFRIFEDVGELNEQDQAEIPDEMLALVKATLGPVTFTEFELWLKENNILSEFSNKQEPEY